MRLWLIVSAALLIAGCTASEPAQTQSNGSLVGEIAGGHTAGQTFVAWQDGLSGVEVLLATYARPNHGALTFHLRASPDAASDLRTVSIAAADLADNAYQRFTFPPLPDSAGQSYYFALDAPGAVPGDAVSAWRGDAAQYAYGALYLDGEPVDGQLTFQLVYAPEVAAAGLALSLLSGVPQALAVAALFVLPGLALVLWWGRVHDLRVALLLAPGVTIALFPLILLGVRPLGIALGPWAAWALIVLGGLGVAGAVARNRQAADLTPRSPSLKGMGEPESSLYPAPLPTGAEGRAGERVRSLVVNPADLALLAVVALVLLVRFTVVRTLDVPSWGDSVHHTAIVQLILDHGGLFSSWAPYAPFSSFTIQYGFHATIAFFAWLTGLPAPRAVVLGGQLLNALAALTLYPLAVRLAGGGQAGRWAGVCAVLAGGLLSPMPMMYVNWGRYAQLAGQAVLPVAAWFLMELLDIREPGAGRRAPGPNLRAEALDHQVHLAEPAAGRRAAGKYQTSISGLGAREDFRRPAPGSRLPRFFSSAHWATICLVALTAAGMLLCSYRMLHFYGVLALALFVLCGPLRAGLARDERLRVAGRVALAGLVAGLLLLPWQLGFASGELANTFARTLVVPARLQRVLDNYGFWRLAPQYGPDWLLGFAVVGWLWALVRRRGAVVAIGLWVAGLAPIVLLRLVNFPTSAFFDNFELVIALYMPAACLSGWLAAELITWLSRQRPRVAPVLALALVLGGAGWGVLERARVLDDYYKIVTPSDLQAMAWVRAHVPASAVFATNGFTVFDGTLVVGSDGGWWLPLLAGRANLMPPQYALANEAEAQPGYRARVVQLVKDLHAAPPPAPAGVDALCRAGATHVYIGQRQGAAGQAPAGEAGVILDGPALAASPLFVSLYHRDRVWIFALAPGACP